MGWRHGGAKIVAREETASPMDDLAEDDAVSSHGTESLCAESKIRIAENKRAQETLRLRSKRKGWLMPALALADGDAVQSRFLRMISFMSE